MKLELDRKVVIVTGGASNIGRSIVLGFASEGAVVVVADLDNALATKVAKIARQQGACDAVAVQTDVGDWESVQAMVETVERKFDRVDVLVNNAGWTVDRFFLEKSREEWEKEINVNLWGVINCTRAVLDGMVARSSGVVVNIASDAGRIGEYREAVYSACKGGVIAMSKSLARELGRNRIRLNVVCPGATLPAADDEVSKQSLWAESEMKAWLTPDVRARIAKAYPLGRVGAGEDVARAVLFLASDAASFVTGQTLSVSGGYSMV
jgi:2-hydroxycyclohexanecarboxyl-CoA dehydrogenase